MKQISAIALSAVFLMTTGCASVVSKSSWPITINSMPENARISISDKKGVEIYTGQTPATLKLRSGSGFFSRARYQVKFEKEGYQSRTLPVEFKLNKWYFGNLIVGGVLGLLVIDPATGAMYKLENKYINETLIKNSAIVSTESPEQLKVYGINEIPQDWKNHLVKL